MKKWIVIFCLAAVAVCSSAQASEIGFTSFEDFLKADISKDVSLVVVAEVLSEDYSYKPKEREKCGDGSIANGQGIYSTEIKVIEILKGDFALGEYYAEWRMPRLCFCRDNTILCASLQVIGSGLEMKMEAGKQYVFWLSGPLVGYTIPQLGAFSIKRADEIEKKGEIQEFLKNLE